MLKGLRSVAATLAYHESADQNYSGSARVGLFDVQTGTLAAARVAACKVSYLEI